jgi:hypothetical protein
MFFSKPLVAILAATLASIVFNADSSAAQGTTINANSCFMCVSMQGTWN